MAGWSSIVSVPFSRPDMSLSAGTRLGPYEIVSAWPALVASVLATLALDYFFTLPFYSLKLDFAHIPRLTVFTLFAAFFASSSCMQRSWNAGARKPSWKT